MSINNTRTDNKLASTLLRAKLGLYTSLPSSSNNVSPDKDNRKLNSVKSNDKSINSNDQEQVVRRPSLQKHSRKSSLKSKLEELNSKQSSSRRASLLNTHLNFVQQRGLAKANPNQFKDMIKIVNKANKEDSNKIHWKTKINKFLDNNYVLIFMTTITIFALFGSSIQAAFCPASVDFGFNIVQILLFSFFSIEIILSVISKDDYLFSFFFWLDLISTISLLQDIDWFFDLLLNVGEK